MIGGITSVRPEFVYCQNQKCFENHPISRHQYLSLYRIIVVIVIILVVNINRVKDP